MKRPYPGLPPLVAVLTTFLDNIGRVSIVDATLDDIRALMDLVPLGVEGAIAGTALYEGREEQVSAAYPLKRLGEPQDIGSVVTFLASDDAGFISGSTISANGAQFFG